MWTGYERQVPCSVPDMEVTPEDPLLDTKFPYLHVEEQSSHSLTLGGGMVSTAGCQWCGHGHHGSHHRSGTNSLPHI